MFEVNDKPFFSLGGQVHNSTAYNRADLERAIPSLKLIHANTIAAPVMWELLEPERGVYDFTQLHNLMEVARANKLKAVVLWFGSWKNGTSHYLPGWLKIQKERFVVGADGVPLCCLSAVLRQNLEEERRAFEALMREVCALNRVEQTVIAVQINNEPGILGSDRDYGAEAEALFQQPLPADLLAWLQAGGDDPVHAAWRANGALLKAGWQAALGLYAGEYFTAYHTARYEQSLAETAKAVCPLPVYVNVWLKEMYWGIPGASYPSGGGTHNVLGLWRHFAPDLAAVAPDIYVNDTERYREVIRRYARPDNPLYIPECSISPAGALNLFTAACEGRLVGVHAFGVDSLLNEEGTLSAAGADFAESMAILHSALPLLTQRTGTLVPVVQQENVGYQVIDFGDYLGMIRFFTGGEKAIDPTLEWLDTAHCLMQPQAARKAAVRGRGLINARAKNEFFIAGSGFRLLLLPQKSIRQMLSGANMNEWMQTRQWDYLSVEEGYLDDEQRWYCVRRRNGDETDHGAWVTQDVGLVRVQMNPNAWDDA
ncbi:DUF5597 domain-containing protein [Allofournierella sp.]|uniref:DUF5597 domain-containing protein n=1 Tax=Allofournierella sp. TaxID=1940256 RepID=UPI003AB3377E